MEKVRWPHGERMFVTLPLQPVKDPRLDYAMGYCDLVSSNLSFLGFKHRHRTEYCLEVP